ncbi:MAG: threonyl-tRNA synthetase editing domain-containing protein, partial [Planctomycetota bacterium]
MILDCYQCSSCYFEDREPSTRIDPDTISPPQPSMVFRNVLLVFVCIEMYDSREEIQEAADEFASLSDLIGKRPIVLCPNVHLSIDKAPEKQAVWLIGELEKMLIARGYDVHHLSFGYHKQYGMECDGNVGSIVGRRFYGSEQKQFLRLLTRLGVCPPESLPQDLPSWARTLTERRLKVLASRRDSYNVAKKMLQDQ